MRDAHPGSNFFLRYPFLFHRQGREFDSAESRSLHFEGSFPCVR